MDPTRAFNGFLPFGFSGVLAFTDEVFDHTSAFPATFSGSVVLNGLNPSISFGVTFFAGCVTASGEVCTADFGASGTLAFDVPAGVTVLTASGIPSGTPNVYLHGSGATANPVTLFLDGFVPTSPTARYKDSSVVKFVGGNPWKEIGTWAAIPGPSLLTELNDLQVWLGLKNSDDQGTRFDSPPASSAASSA